VLERVEPDEHRLHEEALEALISSAGPSSQPHERCEGPDLLGSAAGWLDLLSTMAKFQDASPDWKVGKREEKERGPRHGQERWPIFTSV
jgi:hypothetical protein